MNRLRSRDAFSDSFGQLLGWHLSHRARAPARTALAAACIISTLPGPSRCSCRRIAAAPSTVTRYRHGERIRTVSCTSPQGNPRCLNPMAMAVSSTVLLLLVAVAPRPASSSADDCVCNFGGDVPCRQAFGNTLLCFNYDAGTTDVLSLFLPFCPSNSCLPGALY